MQNIKMLGLFAFIATGVGLLVTSAMAQNLPWLIVLGVIAVGYVLGLIQHYHKLRS